MTKQRVVADASAVVGMLTVRDADGVWAFERLGGQTLVSPHHMMFEAANVLRRLETAGLIGADSAALAHQDLLDLPVELWPYRVVAARSWALGANLTGHDAPYVALAEFLEIPLVTLDRRLSRAPNLRCQVDTT